MDRDPLGLLVIGLVVGAIWLLFVWYLHVQEKRGEKEQEARRAHQAEQARKKAAFDAWYAALPAHEQYMVDQQLAQGKAMNSIAAGMMANSIHNLTDGPG